MSAGPCTRQVWGSVVRVRGSALRCQSLPRDPEPSFLWLRPAAALVRLLAPERDVLEETGAIPVRGLHDQVDVTSARKSELETTCRNASRPPDRRSRWTNPSGPQFTRGSHAPRRRSEAGHGIRRAGRVEVPAGTSVVAEASSMSIVHKKAYLVSLNLPPCPS